MAEKPQWELSEPNAALGHTALSFFNSKAKAAHDRTAATGVRTSSTVGVFSITRRNRNHQDETIRRTAFAGTSHRLRTTKPNPPAWDTRSVALNARSRLFWQRIQSSRSKSMPAFAADKRSNVSLQSINAQVSSRTLAAASAESNRLVRPDDGAP